MDVLLNRLNDVYDVVSRSEVKTGDEFFDANISKPPKRIVTEILEQRKERGQYIDEPHRRFWAKVKSKLA